MVLPTTRRDEHQTSLTGHRCSAPADCNVGIFDTAVAVLSKSTLSTAQSFEGEKDIEGKAGRKWKVDGANGGDQGVGDGSCGPIMRHMLIFVESQVAFENVTNCAIICTRALIIKQSSPVATKLSLRTGKRDCREETGMT